MNPDQDDVDTLTAFALISTLIGFFWTNEITFPISPRTASELVVFVWAVGGIAVYHSVMYALAAVAFYAAWRLVR